MKIPQSPPPLNSLLQKVDPAKLLALLHDAQKARTRYHYTHWDKLRRYPAPEGVTHEEWWLAEKLGRMGKSRNIPLKDKLGGVFSYQIPELVMEGLHEIDLGAGGTISIAEPITNPHTRDRYLMSSLMAEAITSSQLEGAVTTREVAKEMIRTGRKPRDTSEQMILNNYVTMQQIRSFKDSPLTPELVCRIHKLVSQKTLDNPDAEGRYRKPDEKRVVGDDYGTVYHDPPVAEELPERVAAMCAFANETNEGNFVHPVIRAVLLHFWLAYDHPFVDGNGRTARALFYWSMLRQKYWLFEFISISSVLKKAPAKYAKSFLYTETDDNDLTYFILAQTQAIRKAIQELHAYIDRKTDETKRLETRMRALDLFNHRQAALVRHAIKHPGQRYTIESHQTSHGVAYQTARTDLLGLSERGVLELGKRGKQWIFISPGDLAERLARLEEEERKTGSLLLFQKSKDGEDTENERTPESDPRPIPQSRPHLAADGEEEV